MNKISLKLNETVTLNEARRKADEYGLWIALNEFFRREDVVDILEKGYQEINKKPKEKNWKRTIRKKFDTQIKTYCRVLLNLPFLDGRDEIEAVCEHLKSGDDYWLENLKSLVDEQVKKANL